MLLVDISSQSTGSASEAALSLKLISSVSLCMDQVFHPGQRAGTLSTEEHVVHAMGCLVSGFSDFISCGASERPVLGENLLLGSLNVSLKNYGLPIRGASVKKKKEKKRQQGH